MAAEGLQGRVVEIGFGSGLNVPHYPPDLEIVLAVEPSPVALHMAAPRIGASPVPVSHVGLDGQDLPLLDASCDAALVTFTLCTVPDPQQVLSELRRVVRPGGTVHFVEHGLSPETGVAKWQHRLEPLRCRPAGGCHLTRDPMLLVEQAGLVLRQHEQGYVQRPEALELAHFRRGHHAGLTDAADSEIEGGRMTGLIERHVAGAGDLEGDRPPEATVLDGAGKPCALRGELGHRLLEVIAHERDLVVLVSGIGGMDAELGRTGTEDQPPVVGIHVRPAEHIDEERSGRIRILRVHEHVNTGDHCCTLGSRRPRCSLGQGPSSSPSSAVSTWPSWWRRQLSSDG